MGREGGREGATVMCTTQKGSDDEQILVQTDPPSLAEHRPQNKAQKEIGLSSESARLPQF